MPGTQGDTKIHVMQYPPFCLVVEMRQINSLNLHLLNTYSMPGIASHRQKKKKEDAKIVLKALTGENKRRDM